VVRDVMVAKRAVVPRTPLHAVNKIHGLEDEPVLYEYSRDAKLLDVVADLIGPSIMSITTNLINKPPRHRDPLRGSELRARRGRTPGRARLPATALVDRGRTSSALLPQRGRGLHREVPEAARVLHLIQEGRDHEADRGQGQPAAVPGELK
jgi:hypothetical protein